MRNTNQKMEEGMCNCLVYYAMGGCIFTMVCVVVIGRAPCDVLTSKRLFLYK